MECKRFFKLFLRIFGSPKGAESLKFRGFFGGTPNTVFRVSCITTDCASRPSLTTICRHAKKIPESGNPLSKASALAWWPCHGAFAENVDMKMLYGLLAVLARVYNAAVSVIQTFLRAYLFDLEHHVSHKLSMICRQVIE